MVTREITDLAMQCIDHALNRFNKKFNITLGDDLTEYATAGSNTDLDPYKFKIKLMTELVPPEGFYPAATVWNFAITVSYDGDMLHVIDDEQRWDISNQYEVMSLVMRSLLSALAMETASRQAMRAEQKA